MCKVQLQITGKYTVEHKMQSEFVAVKVVVEAKNELELQRLAHNMQVDSGHPGAAVSDNELDLSA